MITADNVETVVWETLEKNYKQRRSAYHTPTFCYQLDDHVNAATVVLRQVRDGQLWFHTDARSRKVKALRQAPRAVVHFYGADDKLQFNFQVQCEIHHQDDIAKQRWQASTALAQQCYQFDAAPSEIYAEPHALESDGFENFAVVVCQAMTIDVLWLNIEANQRYLIDCQTQQVLRLNP